MEYVWGTSEQNNRITKSRPDRLFPVTKRINYGNEVLASEVSWLLRGQYNDPIMLTAFHFPSCLWELTHPLAETKYCIQNQLIEISLPSEIPRWRTYTGSSYNFATENDTKVISASQRLRQCFRSHPIFLHQHRHCPTRDNTIWCKPEVEIVPKTGSTN